MCSLSIPTGRQANLAQIRQFKQLRRRTVYDWMRTTLSSPTSLVSYAGGPRHFVLARLGGLGILERFLTRIWVLSLTVTF